MSAINLATADAVLLVYERDAVPPVAARDFISGLPKSCHPDQHLQLFELFLAGEARFFVSGVISRDHQRKLIGAPCCLIADLDALVQFAGILATAIEPGGPYEGVETSVILPLVKSPSTAKLISGVFKAHAS